MAKRSVSMHLNSLGWNFLSL